ncbi:MAG: hypothetical protein ACRDDZ_03795 [Marinifilaceae bacterium]
MMKAVRLIVIPILLCLLWIAPVSAQESDTTRTYPATTIIGLKSGNDYNTDSVVLSVFRQVAPLLFNAPGVPRFAIVGRDNRFYFGIGGFIKATYAYDFKNPIDDPMYFKASEIPMDNPRQNKGASQFAIGASNVFFNFVGMPGTKHQVGAYLNFNFEDKDHGFCLQYAYLTYDNFLLGYNYTAFCDQAVAPPTIDLEGPASLPLIQNVVAQYHYGIKNWELGIGAEMPYVEATYDNTTDALDQRIPIIPAYVQYAWNNGTSSVRLSGLYRNMGYGSRQILDRTSEDYLEIGDEEFAEVQRSAEFERYRRVNGWGVQLSGMLAMPINLTAYYQGVYGKGIACYIQDIADMGLDLVPDHSAAGKLKPVEVAGGMLGLQYNFSDNVFCSATYSYLRNYIGKYSAEGAYYEEETEPWNKRMKYVQTVIANVFVNLTQSSQIGVEYIWGSKTLMDLKRRENNRVQVSFQFNF